MSSPLAWYRFMGRLVGILFTGALWRSLGQVKSDWNVVELIATTISFFCLGWFVIFLVSALEELLVLTVAPANNNNNNNVKYVETFTDLCWGPLLSKCLRHLDYWWYKCTEDEFVHGNDDGDNTGPLLDTAVLYK
jgi:hypothetical protein